MPSLFNFLTFSITILTFQSDEGFSGEELSDKFKKKKSLKQ